MGTIFYALIAGRLPFAKQGVQLVRVGTARPEMAPWWHKGYTQVIQDICVGARPGEEAVCGRSRRALGTHLGRAWCYPKLLAGKPSPRQRALRVISSAEKLLRAAWVRVVNRNRTWRLLRIFLYQNLASIPHRHLNLNVQQYTRICICIWRWWCLARVSLQYYATNSSLSIDESSGIN
ncbi:unnamed protein product [Ectocarpus sp. 13 AM-2016]